MIFQRARVFFINNISTNTFCCLAQNFNQSSKQNQKASLQSQKGLSVLQNPWFECEMHHNGHGMLNTFSHKLLYGWQHPNMCIWICTRVLQVKQCQPGVSLASRGSWVHLECSGEGYLSERVGWGWGRAVGGAEAQGELPLVNKEAARRFSLGLKHKINSNTIIHGLF